MLPETEIFPWLTKNAWQSFNYLFIYFFVNSRVSLQTASAQGCFRPWIRMLQTPMPNGSSCIPLAKTKWVQAGVMGKGNLTKPLASQYDEHLSWPWIGFLDHVSDIVPVLGKITKDRTEHNRSKPQKPSFLVRGQATKLQQDTGKINFNQFWTAVCKQIQIVPMSDTSIFEPKALSDLLGGIKLQLQTSPWSDFWSGVHCPDKCFAGEKWKEELWTLDKIKSNAKVQFLQLLWLLQLWR